MTSGDWNAAIEAAANLIENGWTDLPGMRRYDGPTIRELPDAIRSLTRQPTTPTTGEDDVERVARAMYADWPTRAVSPALAEQFGVGVGDEISWDALVEHGGNHEGLLRLARAALAAISPTTEDAERSELLEQFFERWANGAADRMLRPIAEQLWDGNPLSPTVPRVDEDAEKRELVELLDTPAVRSAADYLIARLETSRCDSEAVADCIRCNSVYLAKKVRQALASIGERS